MKYQKKTLQTQVKLKSVKKTRKPRRAKRWMTKEIPLKATWYLDQASYLTAYTSSSRPQSAALLLPPFPATRAKARQMSNSSTLTKSRPRWRKEGRENQCKRIFRDFDFDRGNDEKRWGFGGVGKIVIAQWIGKGDPPDQEQDWTIEKLE